MLHNTDLARLNTKQEEDCMAQAALQQRACLHRSESWRQSGGLRRGATGPNTSPHSNSFDPVLPRRTVPNPLIPSNLSINQLEFIETIVLILNDFKWSFCSKTIQYMTGWSFNNGSAAAPRKTMAQSQFPIAPEKLVERAKDVLRSEFGTVSWMIWEWDPTGFSFGVFSPTAKLSGL